MPKRPQGVYQDARGGWYFTVTLGSDPLTGKRVQVTKRGYRTAAEAGRERRELLAKVDTGQVRSQSKPLTVNELLDLYLDGMDADRRLAPKTRSTTATTPTTSCGRPSVHERCATSHRRRSSLGSASC